MWQCSSHFKDPESSTVIFFDPFWGGIVLTHTYIKASTLHSQSVCCVMMCDVDSKFKYINCCDVSSHWTMQPADGIDRQGWRHEPVIVGKECKRLRCHSGHFSVLICTCQASNQEFTAQQATCWVLCQDISHENPAFFSSELVVSPVPGDP